MVAVGPDQDTIYILHTGFPACLIEVLQSAPASFHLVRVFDDVERSELVDHPLWHEVSEFFKEFAATGLPKKLRVGYER